MTNHTTYLLIESASLLRVVAYHRNDGRLHELATEVVEYLKTVDGFTSPLEDTKREPAIARWRSLAMALPCVNATAHLWGLEPEDITPASLRAWLKRASDPLSIHSVRFLLHVWEPNHADSWDASAALSFWDERHRWVYLTWAARPWWNTVPTVGGARA